MNVIENVYPLLALRSLSTNVVHAVGEMAGLEYGFADPCRTQTGAENVLVVGYVGSGEETVDVLEIAAARSGSHITTQRARSGRLTSRDCHEARTRGPSR